MDCVEVCPVDCFYEGKNTLVIHPDECIDCGVCEPECPQEAITSDSDDADESVIGDLSAEDYNLFDFYRDLAPQRLSLVKRGKKNGPCKSCKQELGGHSLLGRNKFTTKLLSTV